MDDKSQSERFKAVARELECDENEDRFNATLRRIVRAKVSDADEGEAEPDDDAKD